MVPAIHRHQWSVVDFLVADGRPLMGQSCECGTERTVAAWDRSWAPAAAWRLVAGGNGRLLEPTAALPLTRPMSEALRVDVWSDVACPWCYIGKRNLAAGLPLLRTDRGDLRVEVEYRSFELAPDTPVDFEGSERDYLAKVKGIALAQADAMHERVTGIAAEAGLRFDFDAIKHTRTVRAHQLVHHARAYGLQEEAVERLFSAYFVEGLHIGRDEVLADLGADIGLDRQGVLRSLRAEEHLAAVRADQRLAASYGIRGVPFYVFDGRFGLSGAQAPETFAAALLQASEEREAGLEAHIT